MVINISWKSMIVSMGKKHKGFPIYKELSDGKKIGVTKEAWSEFYATITKKYGKGAEKKPIPKKKVEESDNLIEWYMERIKNGTN